MAAIAPGITNIQGRKKAEEVMPATPITFFRKAKAFSEASQKTFSVQNGVIWVPLAIREAGKEVYSCFNLYSGGEQGRKGLAMGNGLPINNVGPRA